MLFTSVEVKHVLISLLFSLVKLKALTFEVNIYDFGVQTHRHWCPKSTPLVGGLCGVPSMEAMTFVFNSIFWWVSCEIYSGFSDSASKRMAVG